MEHDSHKCFVFLGPELEFEKPAERPVIFSIKPFMMAIQK